MAINIYIYKYIPVVMNHYNNFAQVFAIKSKSAKTDAEKGISVFY